MSSYNHKRNYERLTEAMGAQLPPGYRKDTFTSYAHGYTVVGFRPYREKYYPNGKHDVRTTGPDSFTKVELAGYGAVWASLDDHSEYVELLGWGNTSASLSDFAESEQAKLRKHRDDRRS